MISGLQIKCLKSLKFTFKRWGSSVAVLSFERYRQEEKYIFKVSQRASFVPEMGSFNSWQLCRETKSCSIKVSVPAKLNLDKSRISPLGVMLAAHMDSIWTALWAVTSWGDGKPCSASTSKLSSWPSEPNASRGSESKPAGTITDYGSALIVRVEYIWKSVFCQEEQERKCFKDWFLTASGQNYWGREKSGCRAPKFYSLLEEWWTERWKSHVYCISKH